MHTFGKWFFVLIISLSQKWNEKNDLIILPSVIYLCAHTGTYLLVAFLLHIQYNTDFMYYLVYTGTDVMVLYS